MCLNVYIYVKEINLTIVKYVTKLICDCKSISSVYVKGVLKFQPVDMSKNDSL